MRDESGLVKILDFGIARWSGAGTTRTGDVVGTLNYMSPEQLAGELVDRRSDIYSVGALAYELITNQMLSLARSRRRAVQILSSARCRSSLWFQASIRISRR